MYYIGIDLGTSSIKLLLLDDSGEIVSSVTEGLNISYPKPGWSEQNPEDWLRKTVSGLKALLENQSAGEVRGIGITGQMNGLVILDENDRVIRPAILWNDGRTGAETEYLNTELGMDTLLEYTGNIAFASFTAPKLMWIRNNEPESYAAIKKIMLPKDYLVYSFTGRHVSDVSDASGSLLFDVENRCWSQKLCEICGVMPEWLPTVLESSEAAGMLLSKYEELIGLKDVIIAAGAGDNEAAALSMGTIQNGDCNISLGTSGTVFIATDKYICDKNFMLHCHAHANGKSHLLGCVLSAASCCSWWVEKILNTSDFDGEILGIEENLGKNRVLFLPYLMGERTLNDVNARAMFIGMSADSSRGDMFQAVMEGVSFGLRDSVEAARRLKIEVREATVCGGGSKNALWLRILASVLGITLKTPPEGRGPAMGAAMLAAVACGAFSSVDEACSALAYTGQIIEPDDELKKRYDALYEIYCSLYPALKDIYGRMAAL